MLTCSFIFPFIYFSVSEHLKIGHHRLTTIQNKSRQKCAFFFLFAYFFAQLKSVNVSRGSLDQMNERKEGGEVKGNYHSLHGLNEQKINNHKHPIQCRRLHWIKIFFSDRRMKWAHMK
jgi:hypothetical protein